ncbi:MAG: SDR family oxidoreductase [Novosphingobium sp.]
MDLSEATHAFVTGGASGLGLAIADALAARGLNVTLCDIQSDLLQKVLAERGGNFRGISLDVRDRHRWIQAKEEAEAAFGPVGVLINNAGIAPDGQMLADMQPESFDLILDINLVGVMLGVSAFAASMRERGVGHIVNTASLAGLSVPAPGVGAYTMTKYGVVAISEAARLELAPHGVGVSVLCPGLVGTGLGENTVRIKGGVPQAAHKMPEGEVTPEHVGAMVVDGIERNADYIITHRDAWPAIEKRMGAIREACLYRQGR